MLCNSIAKKYLKKAATKSQKQPPYSAKRRPATLLEKGSTYFENHLWTAASEKHHHTISMLIISIAVLILFQISIFGAWKKWNSRLQVSSTLSLSSLNKKPALRMIFSWYDIQQSIAIGHNIVQAIWIKRVMLQFQEVQEVLNFGVN